MAAEYANPPNDFVIPNDWFEAASEEVNHEIGIYSMMVGVRMAQNETSGDGGEIVCGALLMAGLIGVGLLARNRESIGTAISHFIEGAKEGWHRDNGDSGKSDE